MMHIELNGLDSPPDYLQSRFVARDVVSVPRRNKAAVDDLRKDQGAHRPLIIGLKRSIKLDHLSLQS